jgi:hypothetical protein
VFLCNCCWCQQLGVKTGFQQLAFSLVPLVLSRLNLSQVLTFPELFQEEKNDYNNHIISLLYGEEGILAKNARCDLWALYYTAQMPHTHTHTHTAYCLFSYLGKDSMVCHFGQRQGNNCVRLASSQAMRHICLCVLWLLLHLQKYTK